MGRQGALVGDDAVFQRLGDVGEFLNGDALGLHLASSLHVPEGDGLTVAACRLRDKRKKRLISMC